MVVFGTLYDVVAIQMKPESTAKKPLNANDPNEPVVLTHNVYKISEPNGDKSSYNLNEPIVENGASIGVVQTATGPKERSKLD